ncbi:SSU ribosomal protein S21p [Candidatus Paraburkholderia calva]|nr:SSU ribosomal protein S21p [Candidatus Paraburkholderia calva]
MAALLVSASILKSGGRSECRRAAFEQHRAVRNTFNKSGSLTTITLKENESFDVAIRCFRRTIEKNGLIAELRERQSYEKPTTARKRKKAAAV